MPLEEDLTQLLYQLYIQSSNPLKARDTLERYKKSLTKADYTEEEITEFLDEIRPGWGQILLNV